MGGMDSGQTAKHPYIVMHIMSVLAAAPGNTFILMIWSLLNVCSVLMFLFVCVVIQVLFDGYLQCRLTVYIVAVER